MPSQPTIFFWFSYDVEDDDDEAIIVINYSLLLSSLLGISIDRKDRWRRRSTSFTVTCSLVTTE
jgi:hypothetical protein